MDVSNLVHVFIYILIIASVAGLLWYLLSILPIPEPFKGWIRIAFTVVVVIFIIFWLLSLLGGGTALRIR